MEDKQNGLDPANSAFMEQLRDYTVDPGNEKSIEPTSA